MSYECNFSFQDLFLAAHNRSWSESEADEFRLLSQDNRNIIVKELARLAGWEVQDRIGSDGLCYTAFAPRFIAEQGGEEICRRDTTVVYKKAL